MKYLIPFAAVLLVMTGCVDLTDSESFLVENNGDDVNTVYLPNHCDINVTQISDLCRSVSVSCQGGESFGPIQVCGINIVDTLYYPVIDTQYVQVPGECPMYFTLWEKNSPSGSWWEFKIWAIQSGQCYCPHAKLEVWPINNSNVNIGVSSSQWPVTTQANLFRAQGLACQPYVLVKVKVTNLTTCNGFRWKLVTDGGAGSGGEVRRVP